MIANTTGSLDYPAMLSSSPTVRFKSAHESEIMLPKTTSGKLRRFACHQAYSTGSWKALAAIKYAALAHQSDSRGALVMSVLVALIAVGVVTHGPACRLCGAAEQWKRGVRDGWFGRTTPHSSVLDSASCLGTDQPKPVPRAALQSLLGGRGRY